MCNLARTSVLLLVSLLILSCSSTTMSGSWSDPAFAKQIKKVYIIGITEKEANRRIFEDTFGRQLASQGIKTVSSYIDLPNSKAPDRKDIIKRMTAEGCDSVLLTKVISNRKETATTGGQVSGYTSGPNYGRRGNYYNSWDRYYGNRGEVIYTPPSSTDFVILTIESILYDLETEEMIWSGQLETIVEANLEKMVEDFAKKVSKDLKENGIL